MTCPHCKTDAPTSSVGFTWWGGFIGAKILNHVECSSCRGRYNGTSGKLNTNAIAIYLTVVTAIGLGLMYALLRH